MEGGADQRHASFAENREKGRNAVKLQMSEHESSGRPDERNDNDSRKGGWTV